MIYLFTALYQEAHGLIRHYRLAKNAANPWLQEFYNEAAGIRLVITGVGEVNAATAVGGICAAYRPGEGNFLLNIGTCARREKGAGIFLCRKIIEQATGRTFYPDLLYRHDFGEETLVTCMKPQRLAETAPEENALYDMEAAAVYQAGSHFFGPHQMVFLKIVSDAGAPGTVRPEQVEQLMAQYQERIVSFISRLSRVPAEIGQRENPLEERAQALFERLCADMHCSQAMRDSLAQLLRYLARSGADCEAAVGELYRQGLLPCRDKREGKRCFETFRRSFFEQK